MVTMTSEMDKTQTSIAMAVKSAGVADNVVVVSENSSQTAAEESIQHADDGGTVVTAKTLSLAVKPFELSNVTISIDLASDDEDDEALSVDATTDAVINTTAKAPTIQTTSTSAAEQTTPKTVNTPTPNTPTTIIACATESATTKIAENTASSPTITTEKTTTTLANKAESSAPLFATAAACDNNNSIVTKSAAQVTVKSASTSQCVTTNVMSTVTESMSKTAFITTAAASPTSPVLVSALTAKVNFNVGTNSTTTTATTTTNISNNTCTTSTNSTNSSVTSMSAPPAAPGGVAGNNGNGTNNNASGAGFGVGSTSHSYHHSHHNQQQQQQQGNQHSKSSAGSASGSSGGADGSHTILPGAAKAQALNMPTIGNQTQQRRNEDAPNIMVYKKMEAIIERMQAESTGVVVRTVKAFMSKVPSVFTGADLIAWIVKNSDVEDVTEALHFAHLLASHGYIFPIDDHQLTVKNDGTFYRFQTPYFWPSNCWEPENTDYAVYLCKRTMQNKTRLELADYEAENLAKLQKMFSRKWEFIFMQAESQSKVAKKRDKLERKVLDSQERAFWDVHRPMPGCVNTTEIDIKKAYRRGGHGSGTSGGAVAKNPVEQVTRVIALRKQKLERRTIKVSKAAEALVSYYEQYNEFDYFITLPELPNPWQTDSTEMWDAERNSKEVPLRRVKRWGFSLRELLNDPVGREQFAKFLEKEYSGENLKFWESVQQMKTLPQSEIKEAIKKIWHEFLAPDAPCPVNVDSKSVELAREAVNAVNGPNRWCFDVAAAHVYHLMKSDSYSRYLRSEMYKDYLNCSRKKTKSIPNLFGVKR
ncbi:regulator of G-protein signaling 7 [Eurosta solidaginis]|uniref:regulator of G-protein signaling 7 n=1 Tax=Eurosta solidaginis TaxID=178769 RepID=UPI003530FEF9